MNNALIYGKNTQERIVSIEDNQNGSTELFIQQDDGKVITKTVLNDYWILTDEPADKFAIELDGNGYYKYKNCFSLREDYEHAKKQMRKYQDRAFFAYDIKESFMLDSGYSYYKGMKQSDVSVLAFDIETVGLKLNSNSKVLLISNTFRDSFGNIERKMFAYDEYGTTKEFLQAWCSWVREKDPSIMLNHNIFGFDLQYLDYVAGLSNCELVLGRKEQAIRFNKWESKFRKNSSQFIHYKKCYIFGREIVDTFFLSVRYDIGQKYESYGLKNIIKQEGLERPGRQFYDANLIRKNYIIPEEWQKIKDYCKDDSDDALALWDLMGPAAFYMTQSIPKSFQEVIGGAAGSQLNSIMVRSYLQEDHSLPKASPAEKFEGAISRGNPGIFKNVKKVDVASLYPSILRHYEIYDQVKDPKGNFKSMVDTFTLLRLDYKAKAKTDKYFDDMQAAFKVFINSCYGYLGSMGLLFNSPKNAALVTKLGRDILIKAIDWTEKNELILVNCDTDAISFCKQDMSEISEIEQQVYLDSLNSLFPEKIKFEHDGYFPSFVVLAAKNYILFDGNKIKTKGSSLRDQKKEPALREFLDKAIESVVNDAPYDSLTQLYQHYIKEAMNVTNIKRWSSKKTLTSKVETSTRANETKLKDAVAGSEYVEADRVYVFFKEDETLCLAEKFDGDYNKMRLVKKLHKTSQTFKNVLPTKELFINYSLKKNQKALQELLDVSGLERPA